MVSELRINSDAELKVVKKLINDRYTDIRKLRNSWPGYQDDTALLQQITTILDEIKVMRAAVKEYMLARQPSQPTEVAHYNLVSETDRMIMKFSHIFEEILDKKKHMLELQYRAIKPDPTLPDISLKKLLLLERIRTIEFVKDSARTARDKFTSDSVRYHTEMLEKRLAMNKRPSKYKRQPRTSQNQ
jgi:hypothetical protein